VLSASQDEIADEAYLETDWDEEGHALHVRLDRKLRPGLCLIADGCRLYVVAVGRDANETKVVFDEGTHGDRPGDGSERIIARYERGAGGRGNLTLGGLDLQRPFVVVAAGGSGTAVRRHPVARCRSRR